jgi:hypothetical protein
MKDECRMQNDECRMEAGNQSIGPLFLLHSAFCIHQSAFSSNMRPQRQDQIDFPAGSVQLAGNFR